MDKIKELLTRGVENIYPTKEALEKVLRSGKKLRLYQGFDPSMPSLHLGSFVGLMKLRQFQKLGHEVIFLIGDSTGMIGDPSGKSEARKPLTREQVLSNAKDYQKQASRILNFSGENPAKVKYNSEWLDKLSFAEIMKLASLTTYAQVIERDMFQKRMKQGKDLFLNELLYPLMQGYDSVVMDVDLEVGGSDQTFNMLMGRTLMKKITGKEKLVLTTKLLVDAQGEKVGKTTGNALFLDSTPERFFGGIMSFPDEVIVLGFELLTEVPFVPAELAKEVAKDPMGAKKRLAFEIVKLLWGEKNAQKARTEFERVFQKGEIPKENVITFKALSGTVEIGDLLIQTGTVGTTTAAKNLVRQNAIDIDRETVTDIHQKVKPGLTVKVGKKTFIKVE